jgi:hypothetical protein
VIHTSEGLQAQRAAVASLTLPPGAPQGINPDGLRHTLGVSVWPQSMLPNPASELPASGAAPKDGSGEIDCDDDPGEDV